MAETEEYFPRGGKKPTAPRFKQSSNFLGAPDAGEKKKKRPKKKQEDDDGYLSDEGGKELINSIKNCAAGIGVKTIKPGLLILGRVYQVTETKVNVMMPGRLMGIVMACHISEPYNKQLDAYVNDQTEKVRELPSMFRPGQYVNLKVLEVESNHIMLSMMPQHVNGGKVLADLHKGCLLQAAVSSVEDHGYVMDTGIPSTRAFLPKKSANPDIELDVGSITWCCVKSATPADGSVVTLTNALGSLQGGVLRRKPATPLLPATAVDYTVDRPLENGIEGHIFSDTTAYIQQQHADSVKGKKPNLGQKIRARVLYVMPTRNTPFLTMRNIFENTYPDLDEEQKLKEGDIVEHAQVIKISGRAVRFKLGAGSIGTLSLRRIQVDEELSDEQVVAKSYPLGSTHKVRVLCYNLSDYIYSVTDQPSIVNEKYFSLDQLSVGQCVEGTIRTVTESGVTVAVGRVIGYVPHAHLTDAGVVMDAKKASNPKHKKKYKVGQEVRARVLSIDVAKQSLILTLKPSLLAADLEVLSSYEQAQVGKAYTGVIKHIRDYVLVSFFNNVVAYVPRHYVTREPVDNLIDAFHVGQIVNCTIIKIDLENKKICGSLTTQPFDPAVKPKKRKITDKDETSHKKHKSDEQSITEIENNNKKKDKKSKAQTIEEADIGVKRKRKKDRASITEDESHDETEIEVKRKKKRDKRNVEDEECKKLSEESDAIETDIYEEEVLSPQELGLVDLSDCSTGKQCKRRVVALIKAIKNRTRRLDKVDSKISDIEESGLNAKNKKFHTAMHTEKLLLQDRIKKLLDALTIAQGKLKEFGIEKKDYKEEKKQKKELEKKEKELSKEESNTKNESNVSKKDSNTKKKSKEIKVVESLEPALKVPSAKEFWTATEDVLNKKEEECSSSSSEDEEKEQPKKKRKKLTVAEKLAKAREEEERLREMERRAIESESQPRSSEQFERAVLANPDCSQLWIAYMAFHLQATEIEKARAVARKALSTMSFREELERLNVWLALLNCEHRFGTKESQQKVLEEALQMNDTYKVHSKLLEILVETGKGQELSSLVDLMLRKYKRQPDMYTACGQACFKAGLVDKARQVMQKAISVLEKKEHVAILVQFALMERASAPERAEALFEQVLAVYPQRVDVCAVYVDMLVKGGDAERVRQVLERMTSQKLPARKMKTLYRKWIEAEERIGDQAQVEAVRQRAAEYLDKAQF